VLANQWHVRPERHAERFPWPAAYINMYIHMHVTAYELLLLPNNTGARGSAVGRGTALRAGRSRV